MILQRYSASQAASFGKRAVFCRRTVATSRAVALPTDGRPSASTSTQDAPVHVTIVGGGAAGLTAAFFAAEHGAKVTVLERTREAGKKILMSGGSRCNVLPQEVDLPTDYHSDSSASAVRAVFASWNLELCKAWLEDPYWGIGLDLQLEEETKKYFPTSNSAREVRDRLVSACLARGVVFKYDASVEGLQQLQLQPQQDDAHAAAVAAVPAAAPVTDAVPAPAIAEPGAPGPQAPQVQALGAGDGDGDGGELEEQRHASGGAAGSSGAGDADGGGGGSAATRRGSKGKRGARNAKARAAAAAAVEAEERDVAAAASPPTRWLCRLRNGAEHVTDKLIIATGGLSFPAVGTDGTGHRLLRALGHSLAEPYPALTPLTGGHPGGQQLAGVSMYDIELSVQVPGAKRSNVSERTALLFTHRGYSGPAVLDLSHYAVKALTRGSVPPPPPPLPSQHQQHQHQQPASTSGLTAVANSIPASSVSSSSGGGSSGCGSGSGGSSSGSGYLEMGLPSIRVNWTHEPPTVWDERIRAGGTALVTTLLQRHGLRERLAEALVSELGLTGRRVCDVKKAERAALVSALTSYELPYRGHEGYKKAEVTGGGVPLGELNCATMESRLLPGLFICGECVDVFGRIGGFNFYWAWVSGRLAGIGAAHGGLRPKKTNRRGATAIPATATADPAADAVAAARA